jgi:hypothetical protein
VELCEEGVAVRDLRLVLAQRRPRNVLEHKAIAEEAERAWDAGDAAQPCIDGRLALQQLAPQRPQGPSDVRLLDDDRPGRSLVEVHGGLIAAAELAAALRGNRGTKLGRETRVEVFSHDLRGRSEERFPRDPNT